MSDERRDADDAPERDDEHLSDDEGPTEGPPPATWAGRQAWSGLPDEPEADLAGEHELPEGVDADEAPGDPDEPDDPHADEGDEPGDEFEFEGPEAEEEEPEDAEPAGTKTVEANTLALGDQEEAREAALAGLRARTAEHTAKRGVTDPGPAAEPAEEAKPAPEKAKPPAAPDGEDETPPKAGVWARFVAASFLIIASMATATAVSLLVYLTDIAKGLGGLEGLSSQLDKLDEEAQNFLILGSDVRPNDGDDRGRSDTTMLLRIDPEGGRISQLSFPRDLKVNIPGHGIDRFNAAYSYGGPKLTTEVVKQQTEGRVDIDHVVNVDFNGFADAVDAIGCVYVDVDRHYLHSNVGLAASEQYAEIDIQAGYQRLCGLKALQYVRYRHEDNDLVRAARQQGFLREARQKVPPSRLLDDRNELIDIFTKYTTSDIDDPGTLVSLFKLMLDARNAQINQVSFPTESLGDESGYVTASDEGLRAAVTEFLGEGRDADESDGDGDAGSGGGGAPKPDPTPAPEPPLIDSTASGQQYAAIIREQGGKELKYPVLYPTKLAPSSTISDDTRFFRIDGPADETYTGYKFVVSFPGSTYPTAYYGVSGTDWVDAPLFNNPSDTQEINGRTFKIYSDAGKVRMVAFERAGEMYWVTNTLDKLLTNEQMLAIAQGLQEAGT